MGAYKLEVLGVGGHGCERKAGPGGKLHGRCRRMDCPDCLFYDFVQTLRNKGMLSDSMAQGQELAEGADPPPGTEVYYVDGNHRLVDGPVEGGKRYWRRMQYAHLTHWPGEPSQVVDDMMKNERVSGKF